MDIEGLQRPLIPHDGGQCRACLPVTGYRAKPGANVPGHRSDDGPLPSASSATYRLVWGARLNDQRRSTT